MDDEMNQNNITLTYQQCRSFLQLSTHVSVAYLVRKQENNKSLYIKNLSQRCKKISWNDRLVPSF